VEEQFYLLWPLALLVALRRASAGAVLRCTAAVCALPVVWRIVLWSPGAEHRIYNGTDTRADQLLAGALVAVALARLRSDDPRLAALRRWAGRLGWPALGLLLVVAFRVPVTGDCGRLTAVWYTVGFLGTAVLSAALVAALELRPNGALSRLLSLTPLAWAGRNLSYGVYLWHYPVARLLASLGVDRGRLPATIALTVGTATLSHYVLEAPLLRRAHAVAGRRPVPGCPAGPAVAAPAANAP
jgi:peptidoglycan/LPS O-acetylase OafA/YrhL